MDIGCMKYSHILPNNAKSTLMIERFSFVDGEIEDVPFSDIVTENCGFEAAITKDSIAWSVYWRR